MENEKIKRFEPNERKLTEMYLKDIGLTPSETECFLLKYYDRLFVSIIEEMTGRKPQNVYNQLYTARKKIEEANPPICLNCKHILNCESVTREEMHIFLMLNLCGKKDTRNYMLKRRATLFRAGYCENYVFDETYKMVDTAIL